VIGLNTILSELFGSRSITKVPFYTLRKKFAQWGSSGVYPSYDSLPAAITFPSEFWSRITEIHRHTAGDMHERAITVWWADGEFVLTENIRGDTASVSIPKQLVSVRYEPLKGTRKGERIITINGEKYSKKTVDIQEIVRKKNIEVQYLFNMHTHPPQRSADSATIRYPLFSGTDMLSFLGNPSAITGLVNDELWLAVKTQQTPKGYALEASSEMTEAMLTNELHLKIYRAQFGGAAIVVRPDINSSAPVS